MENELFSMSKPEFEQLALTIAHLNNFLMELEFKGDKLLVAAELMKQCHAQHKLISDLLKTGELIGE
jgi:hypothetical protein